MELHIKKLCRVFFCLPLLVAMNLNAHSQQIDSTLSILAADFQPEKAYIHYDKSSYLPGETIWYKLYLMEAIFPATESKNVYVDFVSEAGEVLAHLVHPLIDGISIGNFDVPAAIKGNMLNVRAYTRWMLNFDSSLIYNKQIRILSKTRVAKQPMPAIVSTLNFFPEGGDIIAGVPNRIAFKATDQWGRPVKIRGVVLEKTNVIDSIRAVHDGMGTFMLTPKEDVQYIAKWKDEKGKDYSTPLPAVKKDGISMQVLPAGKKRTIQVNLAPSGSQDQRLFHLVGTLHGGMTFKTSGSAVAGGSFKKVISTENIPSGILTITVFDADWNALAERITFVNNENHLFQTSLEVSRWGLNKRARNEIELTLPENYTGGSFSVSVTDAAIDRDSSNNIISHFLLSSELKGNIHNPKYYFSNNTQQLQQQLDLVMMTNGWRRFKWEDVTKGKLPKFIHQKDTSYLSLSGKLIGAPKSQLTGNENIVLFLKSRDSLAEPVIFPINRDGSFGSSEFLFFDTLKVYYQVKSKLLSRTGVTFMENKLTAPNYLKDVKNLSKLNPFLFDTTSGYHTSIGNEAWLQKQRLEGTVLENITIKSKGKTPVEILDEKYTSGMFSSGDGYKFDLINDPLALGRMDVFNYLMGKVPGLQISNSAGMGEPPTLNWRGGTPQLFLDERPVDADLLKNIPLDDVAYVKVFRPPFLGASFGGSGGGIAVYTKRGSDVKPNSNSGLSSNTITGFSPLKQFYSPNYSTFDKRHENKDLRTTLYWNGLVAPEPGSRTFKFTFYNNDITKSFRVVVEGINREGLLTHIDEVLE